MTDFFRQGLDALNMGLGLGGAIVANRQREEKLARERELQPIKQRMLEAKTVGAELGVQEAQQDIDAKSRIRSMAELTTALNLPYESRQKYLTEVKATYQQPEIKTLIGEIQSMDDEQQLSTLLQIAGKMGEQKDARTSSMKEFDEYLRLKQVDPELAREFGVKTGFITEGGEPIKASDVNTINKGVDGIISDYQKVKSAAVELDGLAKLDSAPSQMAMIFKFMKALDPESVVRETEYSSAANTTGLLDRISQYVEKVQSGKMLKSEQVQEFVRVAKELSNVKAATVEESLNDYLGTYVDTKINTDPFRKRLNVKMFDTGLKQEKKTEKPSQAYTEGQTATNPQTGEKIVFRNGQWVKA